jgi:hypothetical protein
MLSPAWMSDIAKSSTKKKEGKKARKKERNGGGGKGLMTCVASEYPLLTLGQGWGQADSRETQPPQNHTYTVTSEDICPVLCPDPARFVDLGSTSQNRGRSSPPFSDVPERTS